MGFDAPSPLTDTSGVLSDRQYSELAAVKTEGLKTSCNKLFQEIPALTVNRLGIFVIRGDSARPAIGLRGRRALRASVYCAAEVTANNVDCFSGEWAFVFRLHN